MINNNTNKLLIAQHSSLLKKKDVKLYLCSIFYAIATIGLAITAIAVKGLIINRSIESYK